MMSPSYATAPPLLRPSPSRPAPAARRIGWTLLLSVGVWLTGCASAPPPPKAAATKPTAAAAAAPASATPAQQDLSGPLSPVAAGNISSSPVASLSAPSDIWDRIRRGFAMNDLSNDIVRDREQWYASRPDYMQRMTERSNRYLFHIVEEIERRGLPAELALLPFIESAFNPQAISSARAAGMWQFMPATGESFDLKQNVFRDDRRDVLASTKAALDYLEQLYARFGDWHLALAAYNWGQGNVNKAITRNLAAGLPAGYSDLDMPLETRTYVPKLQAVKNIVAAPSAFNAQLPDIGNHPFFDAISISKDIDVALIIRLAEISENDFRALNPSLKQPVVMAAGTPQILLPWDNANLFEQRLNAYTGPLASWTAWVVPSTMSVADAAQSAGMGESELRQVNNIPPGMQVRTGSSLLVRRSAQRNSDVSGYVADNARISLQPEVVWRRTQVRARKGDNLNALASRYGVSVGSITALNKLPGNGKLRSGQAVTLLLPSNRGAVAGSTVASGNGNGNGNGKVIITRESRQMAAAREAKAPVRAQVRGKERAGAKASNMKVKPTAAGTKAHQTSTVAAPAAKKGKHAAPTSHSQGKSSAAKKAPAPAAPAKSDKKKKK